VNAIEKLMIWKSVSFCSMSQLNNGEINVVMFGLLIYLRLSDVIVMLI